MTGLVLRLAPNERVLINGAVIQNGNRFWQLNILTPGAKILRLRDAIHPNAATTPVGRLCYIAQLVLSGDSTMEKARSELEAGIEQLSGALTDPESRAHLDAASRAIEDNHAYFVLKALRALLPTEEALLSLAAETPVPAAV